eukprot:bmy_06045T0
MEQRDAVKREGRLTPVLALATLIAAFGSSFQYGYNVAVINSPAKLMKAFYNETYYDRISEYINEFSLTLLWSVSVSMFPFGGFLGSLMVGPLVNKLGRKGTLLFNNIFSIVPAILMGCSEVARSFEMIIVSRLLVGICAGLSSNVVPMYLGELAPKNLRGALGVVPQLFITVGILAAQILGLRSLLANEEALRRLRGWDDVDAETEEIREEDKAEKAAGFISVLKLLRMRSLRWQVISIVVLMGGQQLSGVNAIYYYADQIYLSAGVRAQDVQYVTVGTGAVNVLMTVCAVFVVELLGRRVLLLLGFPICCTACCVLTAALALQDTVSWMPYVSIACVISYVIGHALGPSPIPALLITEIFLQSSRPSAYMVGGSVHWLSNFTVGLIFPFIQVGLGAYSFIVFAVICLLTTIYTFLVVPETKSKTFIEISQIFSKMNKVSEVHPEKEELKDFPPSTAGLPIVFWGPWAHVQGGIHPLVRSISRNASFEKYDVTIPDRKPPLPQRLQPTLSTAFGSAFQYGCNIAVVNTPHKGTLLINNVFAIPAIPKGVSKVSKASELIIFSRVALGVCAGPGISYSALPMHLGELAPKNLRALRKLRAWADVEDEMEEMHVEDQAKRAKGRLSVLSLFTFPPVRWQLVSIIVPMAGQQLSRVNAAGAVERLGPVPSVVRTAIFLQSSRPAAFAVDGAVLGLTSVIVGFAFPSVQEVSGAYSFIIFARICLLTAVYIYVVILETKGRTFMEIKRIFAQRNRVEFLEKKEEITDAGPHIPSLPARETSF